MSNPDHVKQRQVFRQFIVSEHVCSCCQSDQDAYELFIRIVEVDGSDTVTSVLMCTACDLGEI